MSPTIATIDIGANSVRLVLFAATGRTPFVLFNDKITCALGSYTAQGAVRTEALYQAEQAMQRFARLIEARKPQQVLAVATAGLRNATDAAFVHHRLERALGHSIHIIDGMREAYLSALGIKSLWPTQQGIAADLGGGSLELVDIQSPQHAVSLSLGVLVLREHFADLPNQYETAAAYVMRALQQFTATSTSTMFLIGGAWRALASAYQQETGYPLRVLHGFSPAVADFAQFVRTISQKSSKMCAQYADISKKRAETMPYAALLLTCLLQHLHHPRICISTYGLREGLFFEQLSPQQQQQDSLLSTACDFEQRLARFSDFGTHAADFAAALFAPAEQRLWRFFCHVSDSAGLLSPDNRALSAALQVLYGPFHALTHAQRVWLALSCAWRYDRNFDGKKIDGYSLISKEEEDLAKRFAHVLRFVYTISSGQAALLREMKLTVSPHGVVHYEGIPQCDTTVFQTLLKRLS